MIKLSTLTVFQPWQLFRLLSAQTFWTDISLINQISLPKDSCVLLLENGHIVYRSVSQGAHSYWEYRFLSHAGVFSIFRFVDNNQTVREEYMLKIMEKI